MKAIRRLKALSNSSREVVLIEKRHLWKGGPNKKLVVKLSKTGGRNNRGVITCRHRGGGAKKIYRKVDFVRNKDNIAAKVLRLEYDPNRTAFIALIEYADQTKSYILAPEGLKVGDTVMSGNKSEISVGNTLEMDNIPMGSFIHNVELNAGRGGVMARSAGSFITLSGKEMGFAILKMPSGELRKASLKCRATLGVLSNGALFNESLGKAGRNRQRGIRPTVRGVAMNPVDHPNGGRTHGGKILRNPTGRVCKGQRTRDKSKMSSNMILKRRKK